MGIEKELPLFEDFSTKKCCACKQIFSLDNFHKNKSKYDGLSAECKSCACLRARTYHENHKDRAHENQKKWRENNQESIAARMTIWRAQHPEYLSTWRAVDPENRNNAYARKYYAQNPELFRLRSKIYRHKDIEYSRLLSRIQYANNTEKRNASTKKWRKNNPEKVAAQKETHRARKYKAPVSDLKISEWVFLKEIYEYHCAYCNKELENLTKDHIVSLVTGGDHSLVNILPSCRSCNSKKGAHKFIVPYLLRCADGVNRPVEAFVLRPTAAARQGAWE